MDLSDFMDGDKPISYEKARKYFARDPSQKWVSLVLFNLSLLREYYVLMMWFLF